MSKQGIECRPGFTSLSKMQPYEKYANGQFKISNYFSEKTISLPSSKLTKSDQDFILEKLTKELEVR